MEQKNIQFQKEREVGVIISDSFAFLKQEIKPISRLVLLYVLPFMVLYAIAQIYMQINILGKIDLTDQEALMQNIGPALPSLFMFSLFGLFIQSLIIGTFYSYIEAYVKTGKGNFELIDISSKFFSNSLLALGASFIFAIISIFGLIMCFLPGFYFANTFSLLFIIAIYEKKGLNDALSRSWKLVNSQWWNTLVLNLAGIVLIWLVGIIVSSPLLLSDFTNNLSMSSVEIQDYPTWYWVVTGLSSIISMTFYIIPFTFQAFQYFNLKEREDPTLSVDQNKLS